MEADFHKLLASLAALAGLPAERVTPNRRGQGEGLPAIVYQTVSGPREQSDDGFIGIVQKRMQVDCYARTYTEAKRLAGRVILGLEAFRGVLGDTDFRLITVEDERDGDDAAGDRPEQPQHVSIDFMVWSGVA